MSQSETEQLYSSLVSAPAVLLPSPAQTHAPADQPAIVEPTRGPWLQMRTPHRCEWNRFSLTIPALPASLEGFRVVQITDLHFRTFWSPVYDELIARINREDADLILLTGDFVNNKRNHRPACRSSNALFHSFRPGMGGLASWETMTATDLPRISVSPM